MSTATLSLEERTVKKLTRRIIPFVFCLYLVAFLERVNLSYAALTMNKELGLSSTTFGLVAGIFFVGYCVFGVPSNILLHRIGPSRLIGSIMVCWGILVTATAYVQDETHLYIVRFLLGVTEAGFFPGVVYYISCWFPAKERAKSLALFMTAMTAANIVGAPISGWIVDNVSWFGIAGWRWLFITQAVPAALLGIATFYYMTDHLDDAKWLGEEEKIWLKNELQKEQEEKQKQTATKTNLSLWQILSTGRVWHLTLTPLSAMVGMYGLVLWMPQLVKALSNTYTNTQVGFITVIPFVVSAVAMVAVANHSDRTQERPYHIACCLLVAALALIACGMSTSPYLSIAMLSIAAASIYSYHGPFWSLPSLILQEEALAVGIGFINSVGQLGGFFGPSIIGYFTTLTGSTASGLFIIAGCLLCGAISTALLKMGKANNSNIPTANN